MFAKILNMQEQIRHTQAFPTGSTVHESLLYYLWAIHTRTI